MTNPCTLESASPGEPLRLIASFTARLTDEQFECLARCAKGISLRFEASENVEALVAAGYAEVGLARVVTMTAKGHQYLLMRRTEWRPVVRQAIRHARRG